MTFSIPKKNFPLHPTGRHTGTIANVQDEGMQESPWGEKHKISVRIDGDSTFADNGEPFSILSWFTLSSSTKSNLRKFREAVLDRGLTTDEETDFDAEMELVGKRISYRVDHQGKQDGGTRAVIRDGSVEPVAGRTAQVNGSSAESELVGVTVDEGDGDLSTQKPTEDDLPF